MANQEHLDIFKQGVDVWNQWREEHPEIQPDLKESNLTKTRLLEGKVHWADLSGVNFSGSNLQSSELSPVNLSGANLQSALLEHANLSYSNLNEANCSKAKLNNANLMGTNCSRTKLIEAELRNTNLIQAVLIEADLTEASLIGAMLESANLNNALLVKSDLSGASFGGATLREAKLCNAQLREVFVGTAKANPINVEMHRLITSLRKADLCGADLNGANFWKADLSEAVLIGADLQGAYLSEVVLNEANLCNANLSGANLNKAHLVRTDLTKAILTDCRIFGISAWDVKLEGASQNHLIITPEDDPTITVDNLEVAQFIYLLLNNQKIRQVIDTITSKVVLILGRFTRERKTALDALRDELRKRNYTPVLFDFEKPMSRDFTETVRTLAHLARFIIADISEPSSIPQELQAIVPDLEVPVQPVLFEAKQEYSMFVDLRKYHWVLPIFLYKDQASLIASLHNEIIDPAEKKVKELAIEKAKRLERP